MKSGNDVPTTRAEGESSFRGSAGFGWLGSDYGTWHTNIYASMHTDSCTTGQSQNLAGTLWIGMPSHTFAATSSFRLMYWASKSWAASEEGSA